MESNDYLGHYDIKPYMQPSPSLQAEINGGRVSDDIMSFTWSEHMELIDTWYNKSCQCWILC